MILATTGMVKVNPMPSRVKVPAKRCIARGRDLFSRQLLGLLPMKFSPNDTSHPQMSGDFWMDDSWVVSHPFFVVPYRNQWLNIG